MAADYKLQIKLGPEFATDIKWNSHMRPIAIYAEKNVYPLNSPTKKNMFDFFNEALSLQVSDQNKTRIGALLSNLDWRSTIFSCQQWAFKIANAAFWGGTRFIFYSTASFLTDKTSQANRYFPRKCSIEICCLVPPVQIFTGKIRFSMPAWQR